MRRSILMVNVLATALWSTPGLAQQKKELGPLCTTDTTSADQQIDACNSGEKLATIYFWHAVGWNKKGNTPTSSPTPPRRSSSSRMSRSTICAARPIATSANTTSRLPTSTTRCARAARRAASSTTTAATPGAPRATTPGRSPITMPPSNSIRRRSSPIRTAASPGRRSAISMVREAIRLNPALASPLTNRAVIWRAKGDIGRTM